MPSPVQDDLHAELSRRLPGLKIVREASWSGYTSAGTGTAPFFLAVPETETELEILLKTIREFRIPVRILGAGTNLIGSDRRLETVFLKLGGKGFSGIGRAGGTRLKCGAALRLAELALRAADMNLGGLSPLCGIPGTLGGALKMNAGANGTEISRFSGKIEGIHLDDGEFFSLEPEKEEWDYRKSPMRENMLVLSAVLDLVPVDGAEERRRIQAEFARRSQVTPKGRSAGSTFRNPPGTAAGILLENAGCKEMRVGACHVSGRHANWIIADHDGTVPEERDFLSLLRKMKQSVFRCYNINLQTELCFADAESERLVKKMVERKLKIVVLKGGTSSEREVSLISGGAVAEALRKAGHDVAEYDIKKPEVTEEMRNADIVYPVLHGGFGEDGTIQKVMEDAGVRFVGCSSRACIDAMNKITAKKIMNDAGIRNAAFFVADSVDAQIPDGFRFPLIVKPPCEGSTFGLSLVETPDQWKPALELALKHDSKALVEEYIAGTEATVGILDGKALPLIEIRYPGKLYDYDAKYTHALGETQYICPPTGISDKAQKEAQELSLKFYNAVGARDMLRVDVIIGKDDRVWVLEGNTLPGCTPSSLLPKAAKTAGISFPEMCSALANAAANR